MVGQRRRAGMRPRLHQPDRPRVATQRLADGYRAPAHRHLPRIFRGGQLDLREDEVHEPVEEILLVADVAVERHRFCADCPGDPLHRHGLEAVPVGELQRGLEDLRATQPCRPTWPPLLAVRLHLHLAILGLDVRPRHDSVRHTLTTYANALIEENRTSEGHHPRQLRPDRNARAARHRATDHRRSRGPRARPRRGRAHRRRLRHPGTSAARSNRNRPAAAEVRRPWPRSGGHGRGCRPRRHQVRGRRRGVRRGRGHRRGARQGRGGQAGSEASRDGVAGCGSHHDVRERGAAWPARRRPARSRAAGPDRRCVRRGGHVRGPDRQGDGRARDRGDQHEQRGPRAVARRRRRDRLHARGLHRAPWRVRPDLRQHREPHALSRPPGAHPEGHAGAQQRHRSVWPSNAGPPRPTGSCCHRSARRRCGATSRPRTTRTSRSSRAWSRPVRSGR